MENRVRLESIQPTALTRRRSGIRENSGLHGMPEFSRIPLPVNIVVARG
jgi:hypothetical protein